MKLDTIIYIRNLLSENEYKTRMAFEAANENWVSATDDLDNWADTLTIKMTYGHSIPELLEIRDTAYTAWLDAVDALQEFEAHNR